MHQNGIFGLRSVNVRDKAFVRELYLALKGLQTAEVSDVQRTAL